MILTGIIVAVIASIIYAHYLKTTHSNFQKIGFEQFKSFYNINPKTWTLEQYYVSKNIVNQKKVQDRDEEVKKWEERIKKEEESYKWYRDNKLIDYHYEKLREYSKELRDSKIVSIYDKICFSFSYIDYFKYLWFQKELKKMKKQNDKLEKYKKEKNTQLEKKKKDAEDYERLISTLKEEISTLEKDNDQMLKEQAELLKSVR